MIEFARGSMVRQNRGSLAWNSDETGPPPPELPLRTRLCKPWTVGRRQPQHVDTEIGFDSTVLIPHGMRGKLEADGERETPEFEGKLGESGGKYFKIWREFWQPPEGRNSSDPLRGFKPVPCLNSGIHPGPHCGYVFRWQWDIGFKPDM